MIRSGLQINRRGRQRGMPPLLLQVTDINSSIQRPPGKAVPQQMWSDPLSRPYIALSCLLKSGSLCNNIEEPLNLPS
jgi:hypothetical protein